MISGALKKGKKKIKAVLEGRGFRPISLIIQYAWVKKLITPRAHSVNREANLVSAIAWFLAMTDLAVNRIGIAPTLNLLLQM